MDMIYSQAEEVIVWLGEASDDSTIAMKFIKEVSDLSKLDQIAKDARYREKWIALGSLMRRPWFSRRWVVQELAMAKKASVHCGSENVNWSDFADAVALFEAKHQEIQSLFDNDSYILGEIQGLGAHSLIAASHDLFAHSKQGTATQRLATLEFLLCTLSAFEVTNPWDAVYSLLGLASDVHRLRNTPSISSIDPERQASEGPIQPGATTETARNVNIQSVSRNGKLLLTGAATNLIKEPWDQKYKLPITPGPIKDYKEPAQWQKDGSNTLLIPVDYKRPIIEVLKEVVIHTIGRTGSAEIICRSWAPSSTQISNWRPLTAVKTTHTSPRIVLPSWIRDTTESEFAPRSHKLGVQYDRINAKSFLGAPGYPIYNAAGKSRAKVGDESFMKTPSLSQFYCLVLDGYFVDVVGSRGGYASSGQIPPDWLALASWTEHRESAAPDSFWRTLVADRGLDGERPPVWYRRACEHAWSESASPGLDLGRVMRNCGSSITTDFVRRIRQTVWNRQMFVTSEKKLIGLGPSSSRSSLTVRGGDYIYLLHGCSTPVVLRPHPDDGDYFSLIGECYVHGIMDGEAFDESVKMGLEPAKIWLR